MQQKQIRGILKSAGDIKPWASPGRSPNNYQWGQIGEHEVRWTNQNCSSFIGREVVFVDTSDEQNGIKNMNKTDGTPYGAIGGGKAVHLWVDGVPQDKIACKPEGAAPAAGPPAASAGPPAASAGPPPAQGATHGQQKQSTSKPAICLQEKIAYGVGAVKIAMEEFGLSDVKIDEALKLPIFASVYDASAYGFMDNLPLRDPVAETQKAFGATEGPPPYGQDEAGQTSTQGGPPAPPVPEEEDDDIPF